MFLLDTVAISQSARRHPNVGYMAWLAARPPRELYISAITVGELARGVQLAKRRDPGHSLRLGAWLASTIEAYRGRLLPVDHIVAAVWGDLVARQQAPPPIDALIAATALVHGHTVVTRNTRDFTATGATVLNPFT